ncbi:hypothetical protein GCM10025793_07730 [Lysobacter lycopersici]
MASAEADIARGGAPAPAAPPAVAESQAVDPQQLASSAATFVDAQRRFIRTARAEFEVRDVYATALAIEDEVAAQGGFVVGNDIKSETQGMRRRSIGDGKQLELTEYTLHGELTVRVPSEKTQSFLRAIAGKMEFLDSRSFKAEDAQFELLRQQLAAQRAQSTQQQLGAAVADGGKLGQKADAIQARGEANADRDEAMLAMKEFQDRVDFSTIALSLHQDSQVRKAVRIDVEAVFRDNGPGFFNRLGESLRIGWRGALNLVVALAQVWPLWLLIAAGYSLLRYWRRRKTARP